MKKSLLCLWIILCSIITSQTFWRSYPVQEVSWNFCWSSWGICSIELPRIINADYLSYKNSPLYREIYTVMRWGTYYDWRDFWFWSHQGVDIASTLGTPIYAMWDWEVVEAREKGDRWNTIVIKHKAWSSELWSVYAHLDEILVKVWDTVNEKQLIAKMGKTWNTTWIHVHFQIDTSDGKHPYFPSGCEWSITEIVNEGRCWAKIKDSTLDPILFLETNWAIFLAEHKDDLINKSSNYLSKDEINYKLWTTVFKQWNSTTLSITPKSNDIKDWFLKEEIDLESTQWLNLSAKKIAYLWSWRDINVVWNTAWLHKLTIKLWNANLKKYTLFVLSDEMIAALRTKFSENQAIQNILNSL
jgi:hypothetical protein